MLLGSKQEEKQKTLLIIDDEDLNFFSLAQILKTRGYRCLSAINSAEAFSLLKHTTEIEAILMDIMMPGIDGVQATKAIKDNPLFSHIPIIVLTALTTNDIKNKAMAAGANAFLTKPVDIDKLLAILKSSK